MHFPVLQKEVLKYLDPRLGENFIDCTFGQGGHSLEILEKIKPEGKVLGIEIDKKVIDGFQLGAREGKFKDNLLIVCDSYVNIKEIVEKNNFNPVNGILADLGMCTWHLKESGRGFTFLKDEPLVMRYRSEISNELTAEKIVNNWTEGDIRKILEEYGEEKFAKKIAKKIIEERKGQPIRTTFQLVEIVRKAIPAAYTRQKIHFATRVFQALRIAVNDELENLRKFLPQAEDILEKGGRLGIISFHSLEDRIVKNFFRESGKFLTAITKKPVTPDDKEIKNNPASRSAKLRVAVKK